MQVILLLINSSTSLNNSPDSACGKPQTAQHIINHCAVLRPPKEVDLAYPNEATSHWLVQLEGVT